jgi:predicted phosphodiesterase
MDTGQPGNGSQSEGGAARRPDERWRTVGAALLAAALVLLVALSVYEIVAPGTYRIALGEVTLQLTPDLRGGETVLPLGPAGSVSFHTHRTPLDFTVAFVFNEDLPIVQETRTLVGDLPAVGESAVDAFRSYALSKVPWICILGLAGGALVAGVAVGLGAAGRRLRRMLIGAAAGLLVVWAAVGALVWVTYATVDRSPAVTYEGLARHAPRVVSLLRGVLESPVSRDFSASDFARGLQEVARQATEGSPVTDGDEVTRLLVAGDLHDNIVGYRLLRRLAADLGLDVAGVVLVGDLVHLGTAAEARFVLGDLRAIDKPVVMVGGNHEDAPAMRTFRKAGIVALDDSCTVVGGVTIMGFADPLAQRPDALTDVALRTAAAAEDLAAVQAEVPTPPVVVFHDIGQAKDVVDWAESDAVRMTVLHGHDHVQSVEQRGSVVVLDPGSGGASGFEQLGRDPGTPYQFMVVELSSGAVPRLLSVTTLSYQGVEGQSSAEYLPFGRE